MAAATTTTTPATRERKAKKPPSVIDALAKCHKILEELPDAASRKRVVDFLSEPAK